MKTQTDSTSLWARTTTRRVLLWLCRWQVLRWLVFSLAGLITVVALGYAIENWRGKRAWESYRSDLESRGEKLDLQAFIPPAVPDDQNFAMTPFLAPLFDFVPDPKPGQSPWRDTNGYARATGFTKDLRFWSGSAGDWRVGDRIDLADWLTEVLQTTSPSTQPNRDSSVATSPSTDSKAAAVAVMEALRAYEPTLEELRAASRRPHSRFNVRYEQEKNPYAILIPHLAVIKGVCQVLKIRALAELASEQRDKAFADVQLMLYLTDSVKDEPFLISFLVRIADFQIALQAIWEGLADGRWAESELVQLQSRLRQFNFLRDLQRALRGERACGIKVADRIRQSPNRGLEVDRLGAEEASPSWSNVGALLLNLLPRGVFYFEALNYARLFEETILRDNVTPSNEVHPSRVRLTSDRMEAFLRLPGAIWHHRVLARLLVPAVHGVFPKAAFAQTAADEAALACALERYRLAHGSYPERLEALAPRFIETLPHDVITGKPLTYRRTENGRFLLYSVGWNETDDGGISPRQPGKDDQIKGRQSQAKKSGGSRKSFFNPEKGDWLWRYPNR
ncbi:MAG: hypothetical protein HY735_33390 [Verrucomicrobia bacterium]|nr:hypothetical protein [Verrucomicrobiota bacterium]